jgi:hypothetical protein
MAEALYQKKMQFIFIIILGNKLKKKNLNSKIRHLFINGNYKVMKLILPLNVSQYPHANIIKM